MAALTKIQFALLTAVLGLATMGAAGYVAYANTSSHGTAGNTGAAASGQGGANGGGVNGGGASLPKGSATQYAGSGDSGASGVAGSECVNGDVQVTETTGQGAAGQVSLVLLFQNVSDHACRLRGYPGASLRDESGNDLLDAKRTPTGYASVLLPAGGQASAMLQWSDVPDSSQPGGCDVQNPSNLRVTPPNFTQSTTISLSAGVPVCSGFQIHPVVLGTAGD